MKPETCYWCDRPAARFTATLSKRELRNLDDDFYNPNLPYAWCEQHDHKTMKTITYEEYVVLKVLTS
jgi:hypothetical protein